MKRKLAWLLAGLLVMGMLAEMSYAFCPMTVTCPACGAMAFYETTDYSGLRPVCDGETVITGSFNFTKTAEENNAENLLILHDRQLASLYTKNWREHAQHSDIYVGSLPERNYGRLGGHQ